MYGLRFTILGCGSSGGVPRIGNRWGSCDRDNPRNRRQRCSLLVQLIKEDLRTRVLIDSSPYLRMQLLGAEVGDLDGVVYTHAHADHVNGLDDLRAIYLNRGCRIPVWADAGTTESLLSRFGYAFESEAGSDYPPILRLNGIDGPVAVDGEAGEILLEPFSVWHGPIPSLGFRIGPLAYLPDVSDMTDDAWRCVDGIDCWIVDALRRAPHPSHSHFSQTLEWIERARPKRAILTNLHIDLDYDAVAAESPDNVEPAYDGMTIDFVF